MPDIDGQPLPGVEQRYADAWSDGKCTCELWNHMTLGRYADPEKVLIDPACIEHNIHLVSEEPCEEGE